jgi:hypothetical protein
MTIAAGMLCTGGVIFGADTDESVGTELRRRVHKIPTKMTEPRAMITGSCDHSHLMDTAVERIFKLTTPKNVKNSTSVDEMLAKVMRELYKHDFSLYPDQTLTKVELLFAVKPSEEDEVAAWSINCTSVHRMKPMEILGCGDLVQFVADHLYSPKLPLESGRVAMVQVLSLAKKVAQYVGGDSYVHVLRDDGGVDMKNYHFSPQEEDIYEYFFTMGRNLILATGDKNISPEDYEKLAVNFIKNLKWKRKQVLGG